MRLSLLVVATTTILSTPAASAVVSWNGTNWNQTKLACNNSPDLCDRPYNNVSYYGAHDSAFLRDASTRFSISGDQFYNATIALDAGVRVLQTQIHLLNGVLENCHTACGLLDGGPLVNFLTAVNYWMDNNPNEVVTLLLVNSDNNSAKDFAAVFDASGLTKYAYVPATSGPQGTWPTLRTMITSNKRLVSYLAPVTYDAAYPYLLNNYDYFFENPYAITDQSQFGCTLDRPGNLSPGSVASAVSAIGKGYLALMNHFKYTQLPFNIQIPDQANITSTNSPNTTTVGNLGLHLQMCASMWAIRPTYVLVDFFNVGPGIQAVDAINGIVPVGRKPLTDAVLLPTTSKRHETSLRKTEIIK